MFENIESNTTKGPLGGHVSVISFFFKMIYWNHRVTGLTPAKSLILKG
jgi:hypothetical protein